MNVQITDHARRRMQQRGITEEQVEAVMRRPLGTPEPGSRPDTLVLRGHAVGVGELKVVVDASDNERVVSAFWAGERRQS